MVVVTIRNIPDRVRDELAARAARAGKSLQEYLRGLLVEAADKPTVDDVLARCPGARDRDGSAHRSGCNPGCPRRRSAMTGRLVCDASAVVTALLDSGATGTWMATRLAGAQLFAPALMPFECSIIRRHELAEIISADQAAQAHFDLLELPVELWPYELLAARIWQLRPDLTSYDAAYVALAETIDSPLVTVDRRIQRAPGIGCTVDTPPG